MKTRTETPQKWGWKLRKNPQQKSLWFCCGFAYNFLPLHPVKCRTKSTFFSLRNSDDFGTKRIWKSAISYFFWHRKPIEPQMLFVGRPRIYSVEPPQLIKRNLLNNKLRFFCACCPTLYIIFIVHFNKQQFVEENVVPQKRLLTPAVVGNSNH